MRRLEGPVGGGASHRAPGSGTPGLVTLVGAGPGSADLLTLAAAKALAQASTVLYDHLVSEEVLALLPMRAERIYVGKRAGHHAMPQAEIIQRMLRLARSGRDVVRLKGGDGYVFGRGGEEAAALAEAGVPFRVIPGLTAAQGAAASCGIPLTHREHADALVLVSGHLADPNGRMEWDALARPRQTVVFYMAVATLPQICAELVAHGLDADTPAAIVERATLDDERCLVGTVGTLPTIAAEEHVTQPAIIIVGHVVSLHAVIGEAQACRVAAMA